MDFQTVHLVTTKDCAESRMYVAYFFVSKSCLKGLKTLFHISTATYEYVLFNNARRFPSFCSLTLAKSLLSEKISNDQELIQSDPISCPQNQKGNN